MAKIINAKPKNPSGGYERIFNNKELGGLITKVHSASISNGSELENIILDLVNKEFIIDDFDLFLENYQRTSSINESVTKIIPKKIIKKIS